MLIGHIIKLAKSKGLEIDETKHGFAVRKNQKLVEYFLSKEKLESFIQSYKNLEEHNPEKKINSIDIESIDEAFYLKADEEFVSKDMDAALYAKAIALAEGDLDKAKFKYITLRTQQLCEATKITEPVKTDHQAVLNQIPNNQDEYTTTKSDKTEIIKDPETQDSHLDRKLIFQQEKGIGRIGYVLWLFGFFVIHAQINYLFSKETGSLFFLAMAIIGTFLRFRNIGMKPYLAFIGIVPVVCIYIFWLAFTLPPNYQHHKTIDFAGKFAKVLYITFWVFMIGVLVLVLILESQL